MAVIRAIAVASAVTAASAFVGPWKGTYSSRGYFRTTTTAAYLCGAETVSVNASFDFSGSGPLNVTMPLDVRYPGQDPGHMNQLFAGQFRATYTTPLGGQSAPIGFATTAQMRTVEVNTSLVRNRDTSSSAMCVLFARANLPGGIERIHYVEAAGIALGATVWPCPSFTTAAACTSNFLMTNVATLYEDVATWHSEPWSACNVSTSMRSREVTCRGKYGSLQPMSKCNATEGAMPATTAACTPGTPVTVPASLQGPWVAVLQVSEAKAAGATMATPLPAARQVVVVASMQISSAGDAAAADAAAAIGLPTPEPSEASLVFSHSEIPYADAAREEAMETAITTLEAEYDASSLVKARLTDLNATEGLTVDPLALTARLHAIGSATAGVLQGHTAATAALEATGSGMPIAIAYEFGAATAGATSGLLAGASNLSLAISKELPSSAAAWGVTKRRAHASQTSDAEAQAATMPATSLMTGVATKGPTRYDVQPFGECIFDVQQNRCERRRPIAQCTNGANETVDQAFCSMLPQTGGAAEMSCTGCRRWDVADWGSCTAACGGGTYSRAVVCKDINNVTVSDLDCSSLIGPKPSTSGVCNSQPCADYRVGPWSACSSACGNGVQTRSVTCVDITGIVPDGRCLVEATLFTSKPNTTRSCFKCVCESSALGFTPHVSLPHALQATTASNDRWNVSRVGQWTPTTADSFCPTGKELMTIAQWRCHTREAQASMCVAMNAAGETRILPFAFRAEPGTTLVAPTFLPRMAPGSPPLDIHRVRPDSGCSFLEYDFRESAFADASRQGAIGACREIA